LPHLIARRLPRLFDLNGRLRSQRGDGEAFFSLMRIMKLVGERTQVTIWENVAGDRHRRLITKWWDSDGLPGERCARAWRRMLTRRIAGALEALALELIEQEGRSDRDPEIHENLLAIDQLIEGGGLCAGGPSRTRVTPPIRLPAGKRESLRGLPRGKLDGWTHPASAARQVSSVAMQGALLGRGHTRSDRRRHGSQARPHMDNASGHQDHVVWD